MFKRFGGGSSALWKSKNPHSVEYLRYLHGVLVKNEKVTEGNKTLLIEALRAIAEILIWGDQNDGSVFDFFLERQMLSHFLAIMKQKCGCYVNVQLLQTLNILFENIRHETSLYFLLSNNHVNEIITHKFDFNNEEVIAYYISFLKTLSFKLNTYTIHFFFNETTDEFPLFTEAIRFFDHSESMVRIAVRTLTLNIFKVQDEALSKFVLNRCERYFNQLAKTVSEQVIEMDVFARSAQNEASNRERLLTMVDAHLDNMHYVNDILSVGNKELNALLMNDLFTYMCGPLYLASLADYRSTGSAVLLSRVSALFLLSHFTMIIHETAAVQSVLTCLLFGDQNDICSEWIRNLEKGLHLVPRGRVNSPRERFFFYSHLRALNDAQDDHACFYALMLVYCISQNQVLGFCEKTPPKIAPEFVEEEASRQTDGNVNCITSETLQAAQIPCIDRSSKCDSQLMGNLIRIVENCAAPDTYIRAVTVELCCIVLRRLLLALESDEFFHSAVEEAVRRSVAALMVQLRSAVFAENLFLEMFESEYYQLQCNELKMSMIAEDTGLYLPPSNTPLSGLPLNQRLPSGNDERVRRTLQFYFLLRKFKLDLTGEPETQLPLALKLQPMAEVNDCINLNNSDILSCTVLTEAGEKLSRFLVTDQFQLILVEPDARKLGWAIVRFVGLLQDTQTSGDATDSRALHVVVEDVKCRAAAAQHGGRGSAFKASTRPLLSAKFIFDDHIRCMAARQRLSKGRKNSRHFKINLICELLEMRPSFPSGGSGASSTSSSPNVSTRYLQQQNQQQRPGAGSTRKNISSPYGFSAPGFVQKLGLPSLSSHRRPATSSNDGGVAGVSVDLASIRVGSPSAHLQNMVPDDPDTRKSLEREEKTESRRASRATAENRLLSIHHV